ncbi:two-component regulator propeller domain-containing protein [Pontibacter silvestris]|uniref:histidine kinase n=1 Tax=Pontibacter silvestris TaxID=2305183 RepID=A0ABW4WYK9_9BACT|nr:two-component regulator propeller domain-containing protein [Pontibacter silvestris]MCC9135616.1 response regulator [Pontibacter silvestris]
MKLTISLLFLFLSICYKGLPQSFGVLGIEHGLSNNTVNTIYKDRLGFMWFGTDDGLNKYDGYEFHVYRNRINDTTSLIHNQINTVSGDSSGNLWIGTKKGLCTFNPNTSKFSLAYYYPLTQTDRKKLDAEVVEIAVDREGSLYLATVGLGLLTSNKLSRGFRQTPLQPAPAAFKPYSVRALHIDSKGRVWVMIQNIGLHRFDPQKSEFQLISSVVKSANVIKADSGNVLWIGTDNGLYQYNIAAETYEFYGSGVGKLCHRRVVDVSVAEENKLWIATDGGGVNILDLKSNQISSIQSGAGKMHLTSNAVTSLCKDNESRWWIGTQRGGVNIIDRQKDKFTTIRRDILDKNSLIDNFTLSFCEDSDKAIWVGTDGGGVSLWNRKDNIYRNFVHNEADPTSLSNNNATSILRDYENNIWIATWGGGINRYSRATGTFKHYACGDDVYVWKLYEDREKNLWAGTTESGPLYRYNKAADKFEVYDASLTNAISILEDQAGNLWLGTFDQLIRVDKQARKHKKYKIDYPVRDLYQDKSGNFWIGTQGLGLLKFDFGTGKFQTFTESEGLANNSVHNIEEDKEGNLWISTYHGVSKYNPKENKFKNFYETDGLQSNQFNYNASLSLSTGELVFGGIKGFNIFNPDSIKAESSFPKLVITGIRLFNQPVTSADNILKPGQSLCNINDITLPYDKSLISFDFSALEYSSPGNIKYAYLLEGWDNTWNYAENHRTANYSKLKEGDYKLRIKSTNSEGVWNCEEQVVNIKVLPPWYRTWWAYGIYGSGLLGLLYMFNLYKSKQARLKYEVEIANIKAEKEAELNEKKLSFFTNVSHEFRTPLTLIINPVKELVDKKREKVDFNDLSVIYRNARRLLSLVDQLLLFRKAESNADTLKVCKLNMAQICEEVFLSFTCQANTKNIAYTFECENKSLELYADREKVEIILFNLLSNAFKFTPAAGKVVMALRELAHQVEITVKDSGCGIPANTGAKLFDKFHQVNSTGATSGGGFGIGLYLVKQLVEKHKGEIRYESEPAKGTQFYILLPKGKEHFSADSISEDGADSSVFLNELLESIRTEEEPVLVTDAKPANHLDELIQEKGTMLLVEDNDQIRQYVKDIFSSSFTVFEADNGETGFELAQEYLPDIIISDVLMQGMSGLELCSKIKENVSLSHIPVILLTASSSPEVKLKGIEGGADDYITKPFEKELLVAKVDNILKSRDNLQRFFYNEITLKTNKLRISAEYSNFLAVCIETIESHLDDPDFNIKAFAKEMGMSHSNLYNRVKSISGRSVSDFVRFIRLRKVAKLLIDTDCKVNEAAFQAGFSDIKYFRAQFHKLFGMNPSEYIKKYRKPFHKSYTLNEEVLKPMEV